MNEQRLIYTVRGNVDVDELEMKVSWEYRPDESVTMIETYRFRSDGEIARQSKHVLALKGHDMTGHISTAV